MWQRIVKASIYLLVFLMPLFWLPVSFEAFEFNKGYLLFFLVFLGFLAFLARMIFEERKIILKKTPVDIFVLGFLLVMVLNTVFSVDKVSSLYGFYGRFWPNLVGILCLGVFYFLITNNVTLKSQIPNPNDQSNPKSQIPKNKNWSLVIGHWSLIKTFLWSSFFVLLIGYFSLFGVWRNIGRTLKLPNIMSFQAFNTTGGSFEQLAIFLSFSFVLLIAILAFRSEKKKNFWLYLFLFSIFIFLVLIDFWPSFLVISLSLILFLAVAFWKRMFKEDVNRLSLVILLLIISFIFLFSNPLENLFSKTQVLSELPREIRLPQGMSWKIAFGGLKENFIFGSGQDTFSFLFSKYKPESFLQGPFWQIRFDRPASHLAEIFGTGGILGILSYLALIGMFLMISLIVLNSKTQLSEFKLSCPLFLTFFAVFLSQFVFYQNTTLAFCFWFFLALGVISWQKPQKEKVLEFRNFPEVGLIFSILFWVILLGLGFFSFLLIKFYLADVYYKQYLVNPVENLPKLERAVGLRESEATYHIALARGYLLMISDELNKPQPDSQKVITLVALTIREGRRATEVAPKRVASQETLGVVYREIQGLAQGALEWGIKTFKGALEAEPKNPVLMTELGRLLIADNKIEEAKDLFDQALKLRENYPQAIIQLAILKEQEGKEKEAIETLEDLVSNNPFSIEGLFQLGRLYYNQKEYQKAENQFQNVLTIFPNHSNSLYSLGLIAQTKGEKRKALEMFEKVLELNPGSEFIKQKIEELTGEKAEIPKEKGEKKEE
ncbi:MAG: tetratricopeptide repeat protein [Patescibacteria group bacterium]|nr:tetratricopeptide repeat protein [Patescibacteria group bacterium]